MKWDISSGQILKSILFQHSVLCLKLLSSDFLDVGLEETTENLKIIELKHFATVKFLSLDTQSEAGKKW
jgi:hypothetical protein